MKMRLKKWLPAIVLMLAVVIEFMPGRYTLKPLKFEYPQVSVTGKALEAVDAIDFSTVVMFDKPVVQQISRNVRLDVAAGTRFYCSGRIHTGVDGTNVVAKVNLLNIRASRPVGFRYRGIKLADVFQVQTLGDGNSPELRAGVRYRLLSALTTLPRYRRRSEKERQFIVPEHLEASIAASIKAGNKIDYMEGGDLVIGDEGGALLLQRVVVHDGRLQSADIFAGIPSLDHVKSGGVLLQRINDIDFSLRLLAGGDASDASLMLVVPESSLKIASAQISSEDPAFAAEIRDFRLTPDGSVNITEDFRVCPRNLSVRVDGALRGVLANAGDGLLTVQEIDLTAALMSVGRQDSGNGWYLRTAEKLHAGSICWQTAGNANQAAFINGSASLRRFNLSFDPREGFYGNDVGGQIDFERVEFVPDENRRFMLDNGFQLDFAAESLGLGTNVFRINGGETRVSAPVLSGAVDDVIFRTSGLSLEAELDSENLDRFDFSGTLRARERTVIKSGATDTDADLSVLASARTLNFAGDQDCLKVSLPWSRTSMDIEQLEQLVKDAFNQGRAGVMAESRRFGRFLLDVRRIRRITFKENAAEVRAEGRVTFLGPRILGWRTRVRTAFRADLLAEFDFPAGMLTGDSEIGVRLSLERINFKNFPNEFDQYIPDIIEVFRRGALVDTSTGIGGVTDELPFGLLVDRARLYPSGKDILLDLAVSLELGQCDSAKKD